MRIEVCYAEPDRVRRQCVILAPGATVGDALAAADVASWSVDLDRLGLAVFGRRATRDTVLQEHDRVELLRPLIVDPKEARRRRAAKKAADSARPGPVTCRTG